MPAREFCNNKVTGEGKTLNFVGSNRVEGNIDLSKVPRIDDYDFRVNGNVFETGNQNFIGNSSYKDNVLQDQDEKPVQGIAVL